MAIYIVFTYYKELQFGDDLKCTGGWAEVGRKDYVTEYKRLEHPQILLSAEIWTHSNPQIPGGKCALCVCVCRFSI